MFWMILPVLHAEGIQRRLIRGDELLRLFNLYVQAFLPSLAAGENHGDNRESSQSFK